MACAEEERREEAAVACVDGQTDSRVFAPALPLLRLASCGMYIPLSPPLPSQTPPHLRRLSTAPPSLSPALLCAETPSPPPSPTPPITAPLIMPPSSISHRPNECSSSAASIHERPLREGPRASARPPSPPTSTQPCLTRTLRAHSTSTASPRSTFNQTARTGTAQRAPYSSRTTTVAMR